MTYLTEDFTAKIKEFDSPQTIMNWLEFNIPAFTTAQKAPKATDTLLKPQQVLQKRCGNSFQQSLLAKQALQNLHYPCHVFCAKENCTSEDWGRTGHSHIFVVYQDAGEYFWLEHALGYLRGIKAFAALQHVFAYMAQWWLRNNQLGGSADVLEFRELPVSEYGPTVLDLAQQIYQLPICFTASIADNPHYPVQPAHLNQDTRTQLVAASKDRGDYKNTSRGKNRFQRKKYSKVGNAVKQYNSIDMNTLFKQDILLIKIPVTGETASYQVSLKLQGVMEEVARNIKNNQNKLEYRTIVQALTKVFNTKNVYVNCTCDDFKYRFQHWSIVHKYSTQDSAKDPGPGKGIANPHDDKGRGCKHCLLVLSNLQWIMKVSSVINNYIHYTEEKLPKPFLNLIFPKLYGIPAEQMVEQNLIDDEKFLQTSTGLIDAINQYGKNRGKIKKGSNINPVKANQLQQQQKAAKNAEQKTA